MLIKRIHTHRRGGNSLYKGGTFPVKSVLLSIIVGCHFQKDIQTIKLHERI